MSNAWKSLITGDALSRRPLLTLFVVACFAVFPGWLPGRMYQAVDVLGAYAPWRDPSDTKISVRNLTLGDEARQFAPWMRYALRSVKQHRLPLWNPHQQLGVPFLGNGQSALLYPTTLIHVVLPPSWAWTVSAAIRLWIAGAGAWYFARSVRVTASGALASGLTFMCCGFCFVWLNSPLMNVTPWIGWAAGSVMYLCQGYTLSRFVGSVSILALQFLGGHPESCVHVLVSAAIVYLTMIVIAPRDPKVLRALPVMMVAVALAFLIASAALLPMLDYVLHSSAFAQRNLTGEQTGRFTSQFLLGTVFPYANGYPPDVHRLFTNLQNANGLAVGFVGTAPLVFASIGLAATWRSSKTKIALALAVVSLFIASRVPGISHLISLVPGLRSVDHGRQMVGFALGASILAGIGIDALQDPSAHANVRKWVSRACVTLAIAIVMGVCVGAIVLQHQKEARIKAEDKRNAKVLTRPNLPYPRDFYAEMGRDKFASMFRTTLRLLIPAISLLMCAAVACSRRSYAVIVLIALLMWEELVFGVPYQTAALVASSFPARPSIEYIQRQVRLRGPGRVYGVLGAMVPETSTAYGIDDVSGYDAITPYRVGDWFKELYRWNSLPKNAFPALPDLSQPALRLLNLRFIVTPPGTEALAAPWLRRYPRGRDPNAEAVVYENPLAMPRVWCARDCEVVPRGELFRHLQTYDFDPREVVFVANADAPDGMPHGDAIPVDQPAGTAVEPRILRSESDQIIIELPKGARPWLVLADGYDGDWRAEVSTSGGKRAATTFPAYGVLRCLNVPEAASEAVHVKFTYRPIAWRVGCILSAAGMSVYVFLAILAIRSRRASAARLLIPADPCMVR